MDIRTINEVRLENLRTEAINTDMIRTTAEVLYEAKMNRRINWKRIHPKEGDFWMARALQALNDAGDALITEEEAADLLIPADPDGVHAWATYEAYTRVIDKRLQAHCMMDDPYEQA